MNIRNTILRAAGSWALLLGFMMVSSANKLPVIVLIVPFILLFFCFLSTWVLIWALIAKYGTTGGSINPHKELGIALSLSAVLLLVLQSLGQLTPRDIIAVVAIITLGYLYISRSKYTLPKQ